MSGKSAWEEGSIWIIGCKIKIKDIESGARQLLLICERLNNPVYKQSCQSPLVLLCLPTVAIGTCLSHLVISWDNYFHQHTTYKAINLHQTLGLRHIMLWLPPTYSRVYKNVLHITEKKNQN